MTSIYHTNRRLAWGIARAFTLGWGPFLQWTNFNRGIQRLRVQACRYCFFLHSRIMIFIRCEKRRPWIVGGMWCCWLVLLVDQSSRCPRDGRCGHSVVLHHLGWERKDPTNSSQEGERHGLIVVVLTKSHHPPILWYIPWVESERIL